MRKKQSAGGVLAALYRYCECAISIDLVCCLRNSHRPSCGACGGVGAHHLTLTSRPSSHTSTILRRDMPGERAQGYSVSC